VLQELKHLDRVPRDFVLTECRRPAVWTLTRTTDSLVGREVEVEAVLASLQQHGAAVIWGGPGEGKTTIAIEAAARLRECEPALSAFELDMRSEHAPLTCDRLP
jgi:MoxR-like ATPase